MFISDNIDWLKQHLSTCGGWITQAPWQAVWEGSALINVCSWKTTEDTWKCQKGLKITVDLVGSFSKTPSHHFQYGKWKERARSYET